LRRAEPRIVGKSAIRVRASGIADYAGIARRMGEIVTARGGQVLLGARPSLRPACDGSGSAKRMRPAASPACCTSMTEKDQFVQPRSRAEATYLPHPRPSSWSLAPCSGTAGGRKGRRPDRRRPRLVSRTPRSACTRQAPRLLAHVHRVRRWLCRPRLARTN
jgi:hypothetical protein